MNSLNKFQILNTLHSKENYQENVRNYASLMRRTYLRNKNIFCNDGTPAG